MAAAAMAVGAAGGSPIGPASTAAPSGRPASERAEPSVWQEVPATATSTARTFTMYDV